MDISINHPLKIRDRIGRPDRVKMGQDSIRDRYLSVTTQAIRAVIGVAGMALTWFFLMVVPIPWAFLVCAMIGLGTASNVLFWIFLPGDEPEEDEEIELYTILQKDGEIVGRRYGR